MASLTRKAEWIETWTSIVEKFFAVLPWIGFSGFAGIGAWTGSLTKAFAAYAPISWLACGLCAGLSFSLIWWLTISSWRQALQSRHFQQVQRPADSVNLLDDVFTRKRVRLQDLNLPMTGPLQGKSFIDCELVGPAVVALLGGTYDRVHWIGCDLVLVNDDAHILNAIGLQDITMRGGKMIGVTVMIPKRMRGSFPADVHWLS
jgi:hypothetical protein